MRDDYKISKKLLIYPTVRSAICLFLFVWLLVELIIKNDDVSGMLILMFFLNVISTVCVAPIPFLGTAIAGAIFASKAHKKGDKRAMRLMVLSAGEIVFFLLVFIFSINVFIVGRGV